MLTIYDALKEYGFSEKEIYLYLACLNLGTATANDIAEKADLNRSTTYDLLKSFLERGIASKVVRNKTTHFEVASPKRLLSLLEEKKTKLLAVMDQLALLRQEVIQKPRVEVYEGKAGVKTIFDDILEHATYTDVISTSKIFDVFTYSFPHYIQDRAKRKIRARVIQEESPQTKILKENDKSQNRETRTITNFKINSATFIYNNKVAIIKLVQEELIGVLIHDKVIAQDQQVIFNALWDKAN